jgi:GNAT superfamily N-acetyltransferase
MDRSLHLRRILPADAGAVAELCSQLGYPCGLAEVERRLADLLSREDHFLLAAAGPENVPIGWLHAVIRRQLTSDPAVEVAGLVVHTSWRGRGIGSALLAAAEDWARGCGLTRLRLRSNIVRPEAHDFYSRSGFTRTKTSHLFEKTLPQSAGSQ